MQHAPASDGRRNGARDATRRRRSQTECTQRLDANDVPQLRSSLAAPPLVGPAGAAVRAASRFARVHARRQKHMPRRHLAPISINAARACAWMCLFCPQATKVCRGARAGGHRYAGPRRCSTPRAPRLAAHTPARPRDAAHPTGPLEQLDDSPRRPERRCGHVPHASRRHTRSAASCLRCPAAS